MGAPPASDSAEPVDMTLYYSMFMLCLGVVGALTYKTYSKEEGKEESADSTSLRKAYLLVYYLAMAGDWLQGPYVYALYMSYGFDHSDIAVLFVAGFGSSMVFGTFIGSLADKLGRKKLCQIYALVYIASCVTKHFNSYNVLMLGRILGGISTSILFSCFDSWIVSESNSKKLPDGALSQTFSLAMFGNGIVAIVAGVVAQAFTDQFPLQESGMGSFMMGGYCTPFDMAIVCLAAMLSYMSATWGENYGEGTNESPLSLSSFSTAFSIIMADNKLILVGLISSAFEGSMYAFIFMWTPALTPEGSKPPYGLIFATFMLAAMAGSKVFGIMVQTMPCSQIALYVFFVGGCALMTPVFTDGQEAKLFSFLIFEGCVGMYWPTFGTIKSQVVPEGSRATIYNLFRVPLNAIVLTVLLVHIEQSTAFMACSCMLFSAFGLQWLLGGLMTTSGKDEHA